jgi:hypothetical protein
LWDEALSSHGWSQLPAGLAGAECYHPLLPGQRAQREGHLVYRRGAITKGDTVNTDLEAVRDARTILLTTYKRDGTPVDTPVSIAFDGDRAFFRSYDQAWETKRLRNNPHV